MKKQIVLSVVAVFVIYGIGVYAKWDMVFPLWGILIVSGILFWLSDGMSIRSANPKNYSFLDISNGELEYAESTRKKAAQDKSSVTTLIVSVAISAAVCLVHCYLFSLEEKTKIQFDEQYGIESVYQKIGQPQSSIRMNVDTSRTGIITALKISYQSKVSSNEVCRELAGLYPDDMNYGDLLPVTYLYQEREENGYWEWIVLNFYQDEFDWEEVKMLVEYLGLVSEVEDDILTLDELRDSKTFKYKEILEEGEYNYNISFAGEEKYNVKEAQK